VRCAPCIGKRRGFIALWLESDLIAHWEHGGPNCRAKIAGGFRSVRFCKASPSCAPGRLDDLPCHLSHQEIFSCRIPLIPPKFQIPAPRFRSAARRRFPPAASG
jgi:hypothetical protein